MKKIAFVDHSYHQKTKSSDFFKAVLKQHYDVAEFFDDAWRGGKRASISEINRGNFDAVIYFQVIDQPFALKKLTCKNIIWCPMFDSEVYRQKIEWLKYRLLGLKVLSFSKVMHDRAGMLGFDSAYFQYFPSPVEKNMADKKEGLRIFFWHRTDDITWHEVKRLIGDNPIEMLFFKNSPDPLFKKIVPNRDDINKYHIQMIDQWLDRAEYATMLSACNLFIASRKYEGIGMTFLEAMTYGLCVVAPNTPTHNEYIHDGNNGILFDLDHLAPLNLALVRQLQEQARLTSEHGYAQWQQRLPELLAFLEKESETKMPNAPMAMLLSLYSLAIRPIVALKRKYTMIKTSAAYGK